MCICTKSGFVLLRPVSSCLTASVRLACVQYEDGYCESSEKWRNNFTTMRSEFTTHGPCSTTVAGITECYFAFCIKSDRLPEHAYGFVQRLNRTGWSPSSNLQSIVSDGCLFVAIGAKGSVTVVLEWRISFSLAETKLRECPPWCFIVGATMTVYQFFCIFHTFNESCSIPMLWTALNVSEGGGRFQRRN